MDLKEHSDFGNVMGCNLPVASFPAVADHWYLKAKHARPTKSQRYLSSVSRGLV